MRIVNFMNFVRQYDPRFEDSEAPLFETTKKELEMAKEFGIENTFLIQYDALIDERYINLFKSEADDTTELGLWYEIPKQLVDKAGLPWRGREGWRWDWHIVPGFSMAYTNEERKLLIDTAMNDFKEIYGYYPKTVASWLLDSFTVAYLAEEYDVSAMAICRDQTSTDAYTLVGGYFNQAYYPSKLNMFTPAQTTENQVNVPMFRLLGPDPIHNYDCEKYITNPDHVVSSRCYTLEPVWKCGREPEIVNWFYQNYFENEDLGFSYAQLGQENSFCPKILAPLKMQLEEIKKYTDVKFMKMCDTGEWFKQQYPGKTPATCVSCLDDWSTGKEVQSVYYDCCNYVANIVRCRDKISLRALYLFDEKVKDYYLDIPCDTWDATYENLPVIDTLLWKEDEKCNAGLVLDETGDTFSIEKVAEQELAVKWNEEKTVVFTENEIRICNLDKLFYDFTGNNAAIQLESDAIVFEYKGSSYKICFKNAYLKETTSGCEITALTDEIVITLERTSAR